MNLRFKTIYGLFLSLPLIGVLGGDCLWASPSENVTPDQPLYQRVRQLGDYGLLDAQDQALLDGGKIVTRLELAFYTEKAKARIESPQWPTPTPGAAAPSIEQPLTVPPVISAPPVATPTEVPAPAPQAPAAAPMAPSAPEATPTPMPEIPLPQVPAAPAAVATAPPTFDRDALRSQIDELLRELHQESEGLRTRLGVDDYRVKQQEAELEKLKTVQEEIDRDFKKADKTSGAPHFNYEADMRVENIHLSGITQVSATRVLNEINLGVWSDLGGKGSLNLGLIGSLDASNASSGPASLYLNSPSLNFSLDGMLGHWSNTVAVETYSADTDLGDFVRGTSPGTQRFEDPFDIKKYSGDKNMKTWDDYITNLGYVPSYTSWISQNTSDRVFDGLYMVGTQLPLVSKDAKAILLMGRTDQTYRWEEGIKYSQPWAGDLVTTSFSTLWVNDNFGVRPPAAQGALDMRSYGVDVGLNLKPFFINVEGGYSSFYSGYDSLNPAPEKLEAPAGQASVNFYPFTAYYSAISDSFANYQSKVIVTGIPFNRYGFTNNNITQPQYGFIGTVDDLISDRYGWRANLGWKGRQEGWTKDLPDFLDNLIVNFDLAQKKEYGVLQDPEGYNAVQVTNLITVYYPDDTGLWGKTLWGGFGNIAHPAGTAYINNIQAIRNDGNTSHDDVNFGSGTVEQIPFTLPSQGGARLTHLKTFNYITLTTKFQFNKFLGISPPFYGGFFYTNHQVSGAATDPAQASLADPNRPGLTLANIPNLFSQTVYDGSLMYQVLKNVNLMADYGLEFWKSDYTYPRVDYRTESIGAGAAYDVPWGGGKLELRYKHITFTDGFVPLNSYQADQIYSYFLMQF